MSVVVRVLNPDADSPVEESYAVEYRVSGDWQRFYDVFETRSEAEDFCRRWLEKPDARATSMRVVHVRTSITDVFARVAKPRMINEG